ncbi:MAG: hypothetical protein ACYCWE_15315 [Eubacteriales bacterium]
MNINYVIRDEKTNIYMMTEGAVLYPDNAQIFLCKKEMISENVKKDPVLLDSKKTDANYKLSVFGLVIKDKIDSTVGLYAAEIDTEIKINIDANIIKELTRKHFRVWDDSAPLKYFDGLNSGYIVIFRVYRLKNKVNEDFLRKGRTGRNSYFKLYDDILTDYIQIPVSYYSPVLEDSEFNKIKDSIIDILKREETILEFNEYTASSIYHKLAK